MYLASTHNQTRKPMTITLAPAELQTLTEQLLTALLPAFQKQAQAASKASAEALHCLTVAEVAKRLKCVEKTVLKYIAEGTLRAAKVGTWERPQYKVSEADLTAFYNAHRTGR